MFFNVKAFPVIKKGLLNKNILICFSSIGYFTSATSKNHGTTNLGTETKIPNAA